MPILTLLTLPIGNLKDITSRGLETLNSSNWILAEDTRNLKKLCDLLQVDLSTKTIESFHDHSAEKIDKIIETILAGRNVTLVSDAGSPIISDPAFPLVRAAINKQIKIETVPGVTSVVTALEISGLPPHPFTFHGFLPRDKKGRQDVFSMVHTQNSTHIFFESPHRIQETLDQLSELSLEFEVAVARELTKKFEEVVRFNISNWNEYKNVLNPRGEVVLLIRPVSVSEESKLDASIIKLAQEVVDKKGHTKAIAKLVSKILNQNTKDIYAILNK